MTLIPSPVYSALATAGESMVPLLKLFGGPLTWLVTSIEDGILYGYADLGMGCVEWGGLIHESELPTLKTGFAYLERDLHWTHKDGAKYLDMESLCGI